VALSGAACGAVSTTGGSNVIGDDSVVFVEDAEPAIAALPFVDNELLIQPYPGADSRALAVLYEDSGAVISAGLAEVDTVVLRVPRDQFVSIAQKLGESGLIETVQKNYLVRAEATPNDPDFVFQGHFPQIGIPLAWDRTTGSEDVVIAVVDTGVDATHAELVDRVVGGWNVFEDNADFHDVMGHGTMVAGVAGASANNGVGISGVTWDCPLLAVRVADESGVSSARFVAAGILWAAGSGAKVINVSFAPLWSNRVVQSAAQHAFHRGSLVVISAGNAGGVNAGLGYSEALFVGAVDSANGIASFSDTGPFVDLSAPGVGLYLTANGGGYALASGTSFSAPIVSGVAALTWSVNPGFRPSTVQSILWETAADRGAAGRDRVYGFGVVDAAAAVAEAARREEVVDSSNPTVRITRPLNGVTISGRYVVRADATDAVGVADVVLSVDGVPYATDRRAPFRFVMDTNDFESGVHELSAVATDFAGNVSAADSVFVTFRPWATASAGTPTRITFTAPGEGAVVSGDVLLRASLYDPEGLSTVEWLIDGESVFTSVLSGTSSGVSYQWRTASFSPGGHTITLIVIDGAGDVTSANRSVHIP
jgi:subtilisin family serine protease